LAVVALSPLHEQIDTLVLDLPEPKPLIEPERGIEPLDVNVQRFARGRSL
jgi:hypothetical protein